MVPTPILVFSTTGNEKVYYLRSVFDEIHSLVVEEEVEQAKSRPEATFSMNCRGKCEDVTKTGY